MSSTLTFSDIPSLRQKLGPLTGDIAPVTTPMMFKSPRCFHKPPAKSFKHRLSQEALSRGAATLKTAGTELNADIISLATGRPSPEYFPFLKMTLDFPQTSGASKDRADSPLSGTIGKYDIKTNKASYDLAISLNYGYSAGSEQLIRFFTEHVDVVHNPPYSDWQCSLTAGTTSALDSVFRTFCNRGNYIITETYTYSAALEAAGPFGIRSIGVEMDEEGMVPAHLDNLLSSWDVSRRGAAKPFLLYIIPTGQNPTGTTQSLQRRKDIYAVAEKHDLYIIEDEPYYFLQFQTGKSEAYANSDQSPRSESNLVEEFLGNLIPSYLSLDVSGRVLRLDSTSKILAPGLRCSWMTGSADIISRFLYLHDATIVSPSGLSQIALHTLLDGVWGHEGLMKWLLYLRDEYIQRRNITLESCEKYLPRNICSWSLPEAGMFHWIKVDWRAHSLAAAYSKSDLEFENMILKIEDRIYSTALRKGVLCCKGSAFRAGGVKSCEMYFRLTYATASLPQIQEAIARFGMATREQFEGRV
ncbi:aromatic aminotransferase Aro8 [Penicillium malachiteum]|uniref:Aromatic aminotransferase Aro8 n=1 Tax=Penicillium malachiteum TaxID=1324776 RepID=A0AAD6HB94_9EURO|nr:aromatic aminotransferase Aro8 [Penicillium malachiteum]